MEKMRFAYIALVVKVYWKKPLEEFTRKWEVNIKMVLHKQDVSILMELNVLIFYTTSIIMCIFHSNKLI
jgi:hypothetical protein